MRKERAFFKIIIAISGANVVDCPLRFCVGRRDATQTFSALYIFGQTRGAREGIANLIH